MPRWAVFPPSLRASTHRRENYEDWCHLGHPIVHFIEEGAVSQLNLFQIRSPIGRVEIMIPALPSSQWWRHPAEMS